MFSKSFRVLLALLSLWLLIGAECSFVATSGRSSSDSEDKQNANLIVVVRSGQFVDAPVQGLRYESGALSGVTDADGIFRFEDGKRIRFYIGDIAIGDAVEGKAVVTPLDLVPGGTLDNPAVINIARLLLSLDSVPNDDRITLPGELRRAAVRSNDAVFSAVEFLDFADETAFVNNASQLVAVLTASYPFTAVLIDARQARRHLQTSLAGLAESAP